MAAQKQQLVAQILYPFPSGYVVVTASGEIKILPSNKILISHSKSGKSSIYIR